MGTLSVNVRMTIAGFNVGLSASRMFNTQVDAQAAYTAFKSTILTVDPVAVLTAAYNSGSDLS